MQDANIGEGWLRIHETPLYISLKLIEILLLPFKNTFKKIRAKQNLNNIYGAY